MIKKFHQLNYQNEAINGIVHKLQKFDDVTLKAPTGSGKTYIIAKIIEKLIFNAKILKNKHAFLFLAPSNGGLAKQGFEKITNHLNYGWVKGFETEYIGSDNNKSKGGDNYLNNITFFKSNHVYFIGWNALSKNSNAMKVNTEKNNLHNVLRQTKEENIKLVAIIDEAHREYLPKKTQKEVSNSKKDFLREINTITSKTLKVSATPKIIDQNEKNICVITSDQVREEAAIKKNIIINDFDYTKNENYDDESHIENLIKQGLEKQQEIKKVYEKVLKKENLVQTPLILIQIPDNKTIIETKNEKQKLIDYYKQKVNKIVESYSKIYGFKYACWFSDKKTVNKSDLIYNNSAYEVLIFKQALATGWDIPRANILIKLRNPKKGSREFEIQTLGRILRNPFFKYYYESGKNTKDGDLINNGFVFTFDEEYKKRIKEHESYVSEQKQFLLSKKGQFSKMKLNKLIFKNTISEEKIFQKTYQTLNKAGVIEQIIEESQKLINDPILGKKIIKATSVLNNTIDEKSKGQSQFRFIWKKTLFEIWLEFNSFCDDYPNLKQLFIYIVENICKKHKKKVTKKQLYQFFSNKLLSVSSEKNANILKTEIENSFLKCQNETIKIVKEKNYWSLSDKKNYPNVYHDDYTGTNWDKVNSYELKLNCRNNKVLNDSESKFYEFIKERFSDNNGNNHIFRNGTTEKDDYFLPYISTINKMRKFYPDFILESEKNVVILDVKGEIDVEGKQKFKFAWKNMDLICDQKNLIIAWLHYSAEKNQKIKDWKIEFKTLQSNDKSEQTTLEKFYKKFF